MIFIKNNNTNPYINHAIEEYLINNLEEDCFMLWRNTPCILIGKNQNTLSEINVDYVKENDIGVVRRMTGGGAIYNDLGNLNFTFISNMENNKFADFSKFTKPIIKALNTIGVNAKLSGRNDLTVNDKKFSGNAQYNYKNKILHHGSMLFSVDMKVLSEALRVNEIKFCDKAVKSVKGRVTNLKEHLNRDMSIVEFKDFLTDFVVKSYNGNSNLYEFTQQQWKNINKIAEEKYSTWEWNYGKSPKFNYSNQMKFAGGVVQANINVIKGSIKEIKFYGDFFSELEVSHLENKLLGVKYEKDEVLKVLSELNVDKYMANIKNEDIIKVMFC